MHEKNVGLPHSVQAARISSTSMNLKKKKILQQIIQPNPGNSVPTTGYPVP